MVIIIAEKPGGTDHELSRCSATNGVKEPSGLGGRVVFFFQAEDGIRDLYVTGVQTCALPIWTRRHGDHPRLALRGVAMGRCAAVPRNRPRASSRLALVAQARDSSPAPRGSVAFIEIGRASCRGRGAWSGRRVWRTRQGRERSL